MKVISQGALVAESLADYLSRHHEIETKCGKEGGLKFLTTENQEKFDEIASFFIDSEVHSQRITLQSPCRSETSELLESIKEHMPEEAIPLLDAFITLYPSDDEAYTIRGIKHWALGQRSLAINNYLSAIRINPESRAKWLCRRRTISSTTTIKTFSTLEAEGLRHTTLRGQCVSQGNNMRRGAGSATS